MATQTDETWDSEGNLVNSVSVERPVRVISNAEYQQAKQTLRTMVQTFYPGGIPTGTPTNAQIRNWLLALTAGLRWTVEEMDNEG
jgi:surface antigen